MSAKPVKLGSKPPKSATRGAALVRKQEHEWLSFDDPDERRHWMFDVSFLLSNWTCIFGRGCPGVLTAPAPELVQGCCSYGAHFVDEDDVARVTLAAATLTEDQWQFARRGRSAKGIVRRSKSGEITTRLVDDACIFLNRPEFPGGAGCALHRGALERGERPLDLKPTVCWQLPFRREDTVEDDGWVTSRVIQWERRHWGAGGYEFDWWCTDEPDAFVGTEPVYVAARDDIIELTSPGVYALLADALDRRRASGVPAPVHAALTDPGGQRLRE